MATAEQPGPEEEKEMTIHEGAVATVRDCLVAALEEKQWCQAKQYGAALEILVCLESGALLPPPELGIRAEQERR